MLKTDKYDLIIDNLKLESLSWPKNYNLKNLITNITETDLKELVECIDSRTYLREYKETRTFSIQACAIVFSKVIPFLFDDLEIVDYFLDILKEIFNNESTWETPRKDELIKTITGYTGNHGLKQTFTLSLRFDEAYKIFEHKYYYPKSFVNDTLLCIKNNKPLKYLYNKYERIFGISRARSFLTFLDGFILDICGEDNFRHYLLTLINEYNDSLSIISGITISSDVLMEHIFGYHWSVNVSLYSYSTNLQGVPAHYRVNIIVLDVIFPFILHSYKSYEQRNGVYKLLGYSEQKIEEFEHIAGTLDRTPTPYYKIAIPDNHEDIILPNGTKFKDLYFLIDEKFKYFEKTTRLYPQRLNL